MEKKYILLFAITIISLSSFAGGGWVKSKGSGYYKLGQSYVSNQGYYGMNGVFLPSLQTNLLTTSIYSEHGLAKGLSLEAYLPIFIRHEVSGTNSLSENLNDQFSGIGDFNLGLRVALLKRDFIAISLTGTLGIPSGKASLGKNGNLFTGDDEFNQIIRTDLSIPFGNDKIAGYGTIYAGYNNRNNFFTNETWFGAEIGCSILSKQLWIISRINGISAPKSAALADATNGFVNSMSFVTYGAELAFYTGKNTGISASYTGLLDGNIVLVAPTYSAGFFYNID